MSLVEKLFPWQKSIVEKFANHESFGYFLDMGLGKTIIGLASGEYVGATKVLVISINSKAEEDENLKGSWLWWAKQSNMNYELLNKKSKPEKFDINKNQILLINYESIFKRNTPSDMSDKIKTFVNSCKGHKTILILDESHRAKNFSSKTSKSLRKIKAELRIKSSELHTYLLSGTPFTQGYIDLYSQLKLLDYNETKTHFIENYCVRGRVPGLLQWQQPIVGYKNVQNLYKVLHKYAITIKSEEVIDLPEQIFIEHEMPVSEEFNMLTFEKVNLNHLLDYLERKNLLHTYDLQPMKDKKVLNPFYRNLDYPNTTWFAETTGTFWLRARQASIGFQGNNENYKWFDKQRLNYLEKFLKENPENYICFYNYTPELIELYEVFEKEGYLIDIYSGEIKSLYYYDQYEAMNEDERFNAKKRVIIANYASGSTGKNWALYNYTLEFSVPLFAHRSQAVKRNHRIGSEKTVFYHQFYQNNWLDKGMLNALNEQTEYDNKMFDSDRRVAELEFYKEK